jgi:hypothetical protein
MLEDLPSSVEAVVAVVLLVELWNPCNEKK